MKNFKIFVVALMTISSLCLFSCKRNDANVTVLLSEDIPGGYTWDAPEFNSEYFQLKSHRSFKEEAPGLPQSGNHEWIFVPLKSGNAKIVFTKYDSKESMASKIDPFEKVTISYEINDKLIATETNRTDLMLKEMEED